MNVTAKVRKAVAREARIWKETAADVAAAVRDQVTRHGNRS